MAGTYSYRTPHESAFNLHWDVEGRIISDLSQLGENIYYLPNPNIEGIRLTISVFAGHEVADCLGTGSKTSWALTWYADGQFGGSFLRGEIGRIRIPEFPSECILQGVVFPTDIGGAVTLEITLVVDDPGQIENLTYASEKGLKLFSQKRTLVFQKPSSDFTVILDDFGTSGIRPCMQPFVYDMSGLPDDPDQAYDNQDCYLVINSNHPFNKLLEPGTDNARIAKSILLENFLISVINRILENQMLYDHFPIDKCRPGSVGEFYSEIIEKLLPGGTKGKLQELNIKNPNTLYERIRFLAWNGELS